MHEIDDFNYYVIAERIEFLSESNYISEPDDLCNESTDIFDTQNVWLDNFGWL